jgi:parallel beta-helix repeat protein
MELKLLQINIVYVKRDSNTTIHLLHRSEQRKDSLLAYFWTSTKASGLWLSVFWNCCQIGLRKMAAASSVPLCPLTAFKRRVDFRWLSFLFCLALLSGSVSASHAQTTIHVPADQPTIQAGIDAAHNGDTVMVAPGKYSETIDFRGKAITVESSGGPASTSIVWAYPPTHLDPFNLFVVTFQTNETRSSVLSGFTITGAGLPFSDFQEIVPQGFSDVAIGMVTGGIEVLNGASPTIVNNIVTKNGCAGIFSSDGAPLIQNNQINNTEYPADYSGLLYTPGYNACFTGASMYVVFPNYGYPGTAIWLGFDPTVPAPSPPAVVIGNTIEDNTFNAYYSGVPVGTVDAYFQSPSGPDWKGNYYVIENNIVRNNVTNGYGGGMALAAPGIVAQNLIYGNQSANGAGGVIAWGPSYDIFPQVIGAAFDGPSSALFVNNLVANNSATKDGSQVEVADPTQLEFANNIVIGNDSRAAVNIDPSYLPLYISPYGNPHQGSYAPGVYLNDVVFDHNDIFNPSGPAFNGGGIVSNPSGTYGNLSADPLFVDAANNDYHLEAGSPAIAAGNTSALQQLANLSFGLTTDLDGNARIQDATGAGYPIVDMGPYERAGAQEAGATTVLLTPGWYNPYGQTELPLTAQLISPNGTPTGTVTFYVNGSSFGTATIDSSGTATISTPPLALGQTALLATYAGQGNFAPAVSVEVLVLVQPDNVTVTLTSLPNPSAVGSPVTFTATVVSTSNGTPTGDVVFTDNGNPLGSANLDENGAATFVTSSLTVGTHLIVATYPGAVNWGGASASVTQIVLYTVTESLTSSLNPSHRDQAVTFNATVSSSNGTPTGTVTFSYGTTALGTVPLTNGVASLTTSSLPQGTQIITAAYSGDAEFSSNSATLTQMVIGFLTSTTVTSITPSKLYALESSAITAVVTGVGGMPTGNVTFTNGGISIGTATLNASGSATFTYAFPASGNEAVIADYIGDVNFSPSNSAPYPVNVLINDSETALVISPVPIFAEHTATLMATLSSVSASAFGIEPYGTVNFLDGTTLLGSATLNASGVATLSYTFTQLGSQSLVAVYPGNAAFQPSQSATRPITVQPSPTATTLTSNINPQEIGSPVTFTATVTAPGATAIPVGTVTFLNGAISIGTLTLDPTGTAVITTSSLPLGQNSITASYSSTSRDYQPSNSSVLTETIVIALGDFTITVSPTSQSIYTGQATQVITVTLTSNGGWDRDVTLSCGQLPANSTCTFTSATVPKANGGSQLTIQTTAPSQAAASSSASNSRWPRRAGSVLAALTLLFIPFGIPFNRRSSRTRCMLSIAILGIAFTVMSSCSAPKDSGGTTPGVYNVSINATYSGYGATFTHSADFTLTVQSLF